MPLLRTILQDAISRLGDRADAEALLLHVLEKPRSWLIAHHDSVLMQEQQACFTSLLERRAQGEPVAYLTGSRGFWSLELEVTPDTLIPRSETELLVELALERLPEDHECLLADLGTGSGAIALSLASERPRVRVLATDRCVGALAVARRNAQRHQLDQVLFLEGNWLAPLAGRHFDLIVSNPPYIACNDLHLLEGDLRFEPLSALVSGHDGLDDIHCLVREAIGHLKPGGWLLFEHGWDQGDRVRELLVATGYAEVFTAKDLERRDRVSGGRLPFA